MIIVRILGGLGNQLFQYAAGRALAALHGTELKLDVTGFSDYQLRNFELNHFHPHFSFASQDEINKLKANNMFGRFKSRLQPNSRKTFYKQPCFHFDNNFFRLPENVYLQGYFQSEKYFEPIKQTVKNELTLAEDKFESISSVISQLKNENSVSIHIRRGDYKDKESMRVHGVLPVQYYRQAISQIQQKISNPKFYLFSDDPEAALKDLDDPAIISVSSVYTINHLQDFYLMSVCKHNIIANSSFSWWAAWLNQEPNNIVIAPDKWFNEGPKDTFDLYPEHWLKM